MGPVVPVAAAARRHIARHTLQHCRCKQCFHISYFLGGEIIAVSILYECETILSPSDCLSVPVGLRAEAYSSTRTVDVCTRRGTAYLSFGDLSA